MSVSDGLLARFLEDRESLSETEFDALLAALKADAALSKALKDLLVIDGLCAQTLAPDRRGFKAQVAQRLRDLERGRALEAGDVVKRFHARPAPRRLARWGALAAAACAVSPRSGWSVQPSSPLDERAARPIVRQQRRA
ncbi:MAG: hypothetical protein KIS92_01360 [Planctomycetota bacterium]|nr:hypothetical protein [Planctomycetota bacterium]